MNKNKYIWQVFRKNIKNLENIITSLVLQNKLFYNFKFCDYKNVFFKIKNCCKYDLTKEMTFVRIINQYLIHYNIVIYFKDTYTYFLCKCYDNNINDFIVEAITRSNESEDIIHDHFISFDKMIQILNDTNIDFTIGDK